MVNYSISLALGFAGTVEANVNNGGLTPEDKLKGYRGAWYLVRSYPLLSTRKISADVNRALDLEAWGSH